MKNATIEPTEKTKIRKSQIEKQTKAKRKNISLYCIVNGFLRLGLPFLLRRTSNGRQQTSNETYFNEHEIDCNEQQTNSSGANQWIIAIPSLSWLTPLKNWLTNSQNSLSSSRILSFLDRGFGNRLNRPLVG